MRLKGYAEYSFKRALEERINRNFSALMIKLSPVFFIAAVIVFCFEVDHSAALILLASVLALCSALAIFIGYKKSKSEIRAEDFQHPLRPKAPPE